jgi:hypothetical protein
MGLMPTKAELQEAEFQIVEAILFFASFNDGSLGERILALPPRAFAQAADYMAIVGWLDTGPPDFLNFSL